MSKKLFLINAMILLTVGLLLGLAGATASLAQTEIGQAAQQDNPARIKPYELEDPDDLLANSLPVAEPDTYEVEITATLTVTAGYGVLVNDTDADVGDVLTAQLWQDPANGDLDLHTDGSFVYVPDPDAQGGDIVIFTYKAYDGTAASTSPAVVTINLLATSNAEPVAVADTYYVEITSTLTVTAAYGVLANDTDADVGDVLTAVNPSPVSSGTLTLNADGSFEYVPPVDPGSVDKATFTYRASDGTLTSTPAMVTINIYSTNTAPSAVADTYEVEITSTLTLTAAYGVLANDTDADVGDVLTAELVGQISIGDLTFNADGSFVYEPPVDPGLVDQATFTYKAFDGKAYSDPASVTISLISNNHAPVASPDTYEVQIRDTLTVTAIQGVLANDSDEDEGDVLTAELVGAVSAGSLTFNADGSFVFVPPADYTNRATFTYRTSDGTTTSTPVAVTINIVYLKYFLPLVVK